MPALKAVVGILLMRGLEKFFETIREVATAVVWSKGVALSRTRSVLAEGTGVVGSPAAPPLGVGGSPGSQGSPSSGGGELRFRLRIAGQYVSPRVTLWLDPDEPEWHCNCKGADDPCVHVVAAVAALKNNLVVAADAQSSGMEPPPVGQAQSSGGADGTSASFGEAHVTSPAPAVTPSIDYRFSRGPGSALHFERWLVGIPEPRRLTERLVSLAGKIKGLAATKEDYGVDEALSGHIHGALAKAVIPRLFARLASLPAVTLDGQPITTKSSAVSYRAQVEEHQPQVYTLRIAKEEAVTEEFLNGVARQGSWLRSLTTPEGLSTSILERLTSPQGMVFSADGVIDLVSEWIPKLRQQMVIEQPASLPPLVAAELKPQIEFARLDGGRATVCARLYYYTAHPVAEVVVDQGRARLRLKAGGAVVPERSPAAEQTQIRRLQSDLHLVPGQPLVLTSAEAAQFQTRLTGWDVKDAADGALDVKGELTPELFFDNDTGALSIKFSGAQAHAIDAAHIDAAQVLKAWQSGERLLSLGPSAGFVKLPAAWLDAHQDRIERLLQARAERHSPARLDVLSLMTDTKTDLQNAPADFRTLHNELQNFTGISASVLPADFTAELRPYQKQGVDWLAFHRDMQLGALLADDMGLGKTVQTLAVLKGRTLVVAPTSVLRTWVNEAARFRPELPLNLYHGPLRALNEGPGLTVTSYGVLRLDEEKLASQEWDTIVVDEAQNIRNPDAQSARAVRKLKASFKLALTGTPVENKPEDLWSIFEFILPGWLGARAQAQRVISSEKQRRSKIRPFLMRRKKIDVAPDLPPRIENIQTIELTENERATYDAIRAASLVSAKSALATEGVSENQSVLGILETLLRLRQACCDTRLVPGAAPKEADSGRWTALAQGVESSKTTALLDSLEELTQEGHRALVFSQWTSYLDLIQAGCVARGLSFDRLDGSTRDRAGVVARFQKEDGPGVLLLSLKAGGVGLTLTAADHVFITDPWWNPAAEDQAADRAHRIGQNKSVFIHKLIAAGTIEEAVYELQTRKRQLAQGVLEDGLQGADALTRKDLEELLARA